MFEEADDYFDEDDYLPVPEGERERTCCFSGHRLMTGSERATALYRLRSTVLWLYSRGITIFRAGGALGFDTLCAAIIIDLRRTNTEMKLVLDLPYPSQTAHWDKNDKRVYEFMKENADKVNYYGSDPKSREAATACLMKRNRAMVDNSSVLLCYLKNDKGGTAYTVNYARNNNLEVINLAELPSE